MENSINERINRILLEFKYKSIRQFAANIGVAATSLNDIIRNGAEPKFSTLDKILTAEPSISAEWLFRGSGNMLKDSSVIIGSNNNIRYNSKGNGNINGSGNIGVGNTINVALPESGTQKIIRPDGGVEIINSDSNCKELDQLKKENDFLKSENSHFQSTMVLKDDLIASLRDTIELLKHKQQV